MTNEARIASYIIKNALGTLTPAERQELDAWRQSSNANQQLFDQYSQSKKILFELNKRTKRNKRISEVLERFVQEQKVASSEIHVPAIHKWKWAVASVILVLGIGAYLWTINKNNTKPTITIAKTVDIVPGKDGAILTLADGSQVSLDTIQNATVALQAGVTAKVINGTLLYEGKGNEVAYNTMSTPKGRQYRVSLPDGTQVWLNAASSIRYPTTFIGNKRRVEISGEAYFEVAKNKEKPFIVKFASDEVTVLGTSFNMNTYTDEGAAKISLVEGLIKVNGQILQPGYAYVSGKISKSDIEQDIAWKNGYFNFNNADLPSAMRQLARWYDIEIKYSATPRAYAFRGELNRNLKLSDILEILSNDMGVKCTLSGRILFVQ